MPSQWNAEAWLLLVGAWALASFIIVGYWSILRRQDKTRAAELSELASKKQSEADSLQTRLQTEVLTPNQREELLKHHARLVADRDYWRSRSEAWECGEV